MRKITAIIIGIVLSISVVGCGEEPKQIGGEVQNITATANDNSEGNNATDTTSGNSSLETKGYVFSYNGVDVIVNADVNDSVSKLGDPESYYEAPSCAFDGIEKTYTYSGFTISTYVDGDVDRVASVLITNDIVSTKEGVSVGEDASRVEEVYGEASVKEENSLLYTKDNMNLYFILEAGKIVQIEYNTTSVVK